MGSYEEEASKLECHLCSSPYDSFRVPMRSPCGHVNCRSCLLKWKKECAASRKDFSCSICRAIQSFDNYVIDEETSRKVFRVQLRLNLLDAKLSQPLKCCEMRHIRDTCMREVNWQLDAYICINCNASTILDLVAKSHLPLKRQRLEQLAVCKECTHAHRASKHILLDLFTILSIRDGDLMTLTDKMLDDVLRHPQQKMVKAPLVVALWLSLLHRNGCAFDVCLPFLLDRLMTYPTYSCVIPMDRLTRQSEQLAGCFVWQLFELLDGFVTRMLNDANAKGSMNMDLCGALCTAVNLVSTHIREADVFNERFMMNLWKRLGHMLIKVRNQLSALDGNDELFSRDRIESVKSIMNIMVLYTGTLEAARLSFEIINDELESLDRLCSINKMISEDQEVQRYRFSLIASFKRVTKGTELPAPPR